jgi:hypothetical protein
MRNRQAVLAVFAALTVSACLWTAARAAVDHAGAAKPPGVEVAKADLAKLVGSYASVDKEQTDYAVKVELQEGRLRLSMTKGPAFPPTLLIPTSATRFRWEGEGMAPGLTVTFHVDGGKATSLTVIQPGMPNTLMKRTD